MTDLVVTAASVVPGGSATIVHGIAGVAISAGQVLYQEATTGLWKLADSNSGTTEAKTAWGIALDNAAANQPVSVCTGGDITIGATLVPGTAYFLSESPGGIEPVADQGATENVCLLGFAKSATVLTVRITAPGVTL